MAWYNRSEAGKAARERYNSSQKRRDAVARANASEKAAATRKAYRLSEHGKAVRARCQLYRRARKHRADGAHCAADIARLLRECGGICLCGVSVADGYHVDHIVPLSRGGSDWPDNLQILCPSCNRHKGAKTQEEWNALRGD